MTEDYIIQMKKLVTLGNEVNIRDAETRVRLFREVVIVWWGYRLSYLEYQFLFFPTFINL